jgi:hypothetical protein
VVAEVFSRPEYGWIEHQRVTSWLVRFWSNLLSWLDGLETQHPVVFNVGLTVVVVLLVVLLVHIGYVLWRIVQPAARTGQTATVITGGRVMDAAAHLRRAEELAAAGRYTEALGHRFLAVVLELDSRKALRFHASKTPAEYVAEARLSESARAGLASLVAQLYRHLFGAVPCDAEEYRAFRATSQEVAGGARVVPA